MVFKGIYIKPLFFYQWIYLRIMILWSSGKSRNGPDIRFLSPVSGRISHLSCGLAGYPVSGRISNSDPAFAGYSINLISGPSPVIRCYKRTWKLDFNSMQEAWEILEAWFHSSLLNAFVQCKIHSCALLLLFFSWLMPTFAYFHWIINLIYNSWLSIIHA